MRAVTANIKPGPALLHLMASGVVDQISIVAKKARGTDTAFSFHFSAPIMKKAADHYYLRPSEIGFARFSCLHPCFPRPHSIAPQCFYTAANHDVYRLEYKVVHSRLSLRGIAHAVKLLFRASTRRKKTALSIPLSIGPR
jgi:hypothetical protein